MVNYFQSQTNVITLNIGLNVFFEAQLQIFLINKFLTFFDFKMTYEKVVIIFVDELKINNS